MLEVWQSLLFCFVLIDNCFAVEYFGQKVGSCGDSSVASLSTSQRIVGGEQAPDRAWGWMISLQANGVHRCGASLLTAEFALTAAHCLSDFVSNPSALSILAGTNFLSRPTAGTAQRRPVNAIYLHSAYRSVAGGNDIALIRFPLLSTGNQSTLSFVCLPTAGSNTVVAGENIIAIGWGFTSAKLKLNSDSLKQVTLKAIDDNNPTCKLSVGTRDNVLCAGILAGGKDTCNGDSGGPLMKMENNRWYQVGITSSGVGCARPNTVGIYTKVSSFLTFIDDVLNQHISTTSGLLSLSNNTTVVNGSFSTYSQEKGSGNRKISVISSWTIFLSLFIAQVLR